MQDSYESVTSLGFGQGWGINPAPCHRDSQSCRTRSAQPPQPCPSSVLPRRATGASLSAVSQLCRCRHRASLGAAGAAAGSGNDPLVPGAVSAWFLEAAEGHPANHRLEPGEDAAGAGEGAEAGRESPAVPEGCRGPQRQSGQRDWDGDGRDASSGRQCSDGRCVGHLLGGARGERPPEFGAAPSLTRQQDPDGALESPSAAPRHTGSWGSRENSQRHPSPCETLDGGAGLRPPGWVQGRLQWAGRCPPKSRRGPGGDTPQLPRQRRALCLAAHHPAWRGGCQTSPAVGRAGPPVPAHGEPV
ncbi:uncharacterized protein [Ciconia boyciana]|uniref:uncharacterized protein n=1 Tax=Ciconia boyciana TaxID=52775 RepID=UPI003BA0EF85